jgi:hypothetical protein
MSTWNRKAKEGPPPDVLKEHLGYDPETGDLWWCKQTRGRTLFTPLGKGSRTEYIQVGFEKQVYFAHRLIFAMAHGYWPGEVDHINCNKRDNRISNLREVTRSQNLTNKGLKSNNTSGVTGVSWDSTAKSWRAYVRVGGTAVFRRARSFEAAVELRKKLENQYYGEHKYAI